MSARLRARWAALLPTEEPARPRRLWAEARALIAALASPQTLVRDVEAMGALWSEARRVEARDPALAEALRREAAKHCA